ncbi:MAG: hypothetical protein IPL26_09290 [Leptospiraceae bacterium]|nr:hypothetical protein [Leptospiraceae bacterium]
MELISPKNNSPIDISSSHSIFFQWKRPSYKAKFLFEISESSDFNKKIHSLETENFSESYSINQEGKYYWRVISLSEDGSNLAKSPTYSFQTQEIKELIPVYPSKNEKIDMTPLNSINFKWEKIQMELRLY